MLTSSHRPGLRGCCDLGSGCVLIAPINVLADALSKMKSDGFVFLPEFCPNLPTLACAKSLGIIATIPGVTAVQSIRPRQQHAAPTNIYSGNYGLGKFPLHTDLAHWYLPPRYMLLRCIHPADQVATPLLHRDSALSGISLLTIRRAVYQPRRRMDGRLSLLRLIQPTHS